MLDWSNTCDIPHEIGPLLDTQAKFYETVDFAFDLTRAAIAESQQSGQSRT
jgi:hypothetical protein